MSKKLVNILLLVSLAFNLAVVGAFVFMTLRMPPRHRMMQPGAHREDFRPHRPLRNGSWADSDSIRALRTKFRQTKEEFMTELGKDPIDAAKLELILQRSLIEQSNLERELGRRLIERRKTMTADEAEDFFERRAERIRRRSERINRYNETDDNPTREDNPERSGRQRRRFRRQ